MAVGGSSISLKLLIDTKNEKVLFAEAGKDCVDFLFNLLSLPLGTVVKLLRNRHMVCSLEKLYKSVEDLDESYIQPSQRKDTLLSPELHGGAGGAAAASIALFALNDTPPVFTPKKKKKNYPKKKNDAPPTPSKFKEFYRCRNLCSEDQGRMVMYMSDDPRVICPGCYATISTEMVYVSPSGSELREIKVGDDEGGFVKGVATYMIMDDLQVKPLSAISNISLLNNFNVKDVGALEEKLVDIGIDEALKLLKASLESKTVLTDVFLGDVGQSSRMASW